jgi:ribokinase
MGRVLVLGSLNVDLVTSVERHPRPGETVLGDGLSRLAGGKGANQAVAARAAGVEVTMVGCVGADAGGAAYRKRLAGRGIDVAHVRTVSGEPTGTALIAVSDDAENAIIVVPGANAALDDREVEAVESLTVGDVLLLQLEVPLPVVCRAARRAAARGVRVVINIAPYAALPADVIALADPVIANEHEAVALAESGAVPGSLLVTYGANGTSWKRSDLVGAVGPAPSGARHHRRRGRFLWCPRRCAGPRSPRESRHGCRAGRGCFRRPAGGGPGRPGVVNHRP